MKPASCMVRSGCKHPCMLLQLLFFSYCLNFRGAEQGVNGQESGRLPLLWQAGFAHGVVQQVKTQQQAGTVTEGLK